MEAHDSKAAVAAAPRTPVWPAEAVDVASAGAGSAGGGAAAGRPSGWRQHAPALSPAATAHRAAALVAHGGAVSATAGAGPVQWHDGAPRRVASAPASLDAVPSGEPSVGAGAGAGAGGVRAGRADTAGGLLGDVGVASSAAGDRGSATMAATMMAVRAVATAAAAADPTGGISAASGSSSGSGSSASGDAAVMPPPSSLSVAEAEREAARWALSPTLAAIVELFIA